MSETDLIKAGVEAALQPFANLIERLFGGSADEIGGMWQDEFKVRRRIRQIKLFERLQAVLNDAGIQPQQVPDKIWMPILQFASMEDNDFLQEQWAALLANAANPETAGDVRASFPDMLRGLSKAEAVFLNAIYDEVSERLQEEYPPGLRMSRFVEGVDLGKGTQLIWLYAGAGLTKNEVADLITHGGQGKPCVDDDLTGYQVALTNLRRQQLISSRLSIEVGNRLEDIGKVKQEERHFMTVLGYEFVKACRRPTPKPQ